MSSEFKASLDYSEFQATKVYKVTLCKKQTNRKKRKRREGRGRRSGETAQIQQLQVLTALLEDPSSVLRTYVWWFKPSVTPTSGLLTPSFEFSGHLHLYAHTHTVTIQINTIKSKKNKPSKRIYKYIYVYWHNNIKQKSTVGKSKLLWDDLALHMELNKSRYQCEGMHTLTAVLLDLWEWVPGLPEQIIAHKRSDPYRKWVVLHIILIIATTI